MVGTTGSSGGAPSEPMAPPPRRGSSNTKFYVVIVVLILVIAGVAVYASTLTGKVTTKTVTKIVYKTPTGQTYATSAAQYGASTAAVGQQYSFSVYPNGYFDSITVFWGDGASTSIGSGNNTNESFSHVYDSTGTYGIYYQVGTGNGTYATNIASIFPLTVGYSSVGQQTQVAPYINIGTLDLDMSTSTLYNSNITQLYTFGTGANANFNVSYAAPALNFQFGVINQTIVIYKGSNVVQTIQYPYEFTGSGYSATTNLVLNMSSLADGYYTVDVITQSAQTDPTTGALLSGIYTTHSYYDIPVASNVGIQAASTAQAQGQLTRVEIGVGGYKTLDPAVEYDTASYEIIINTLLPMYSYNGSSSSNFTAVLANQIPAINNGMINNNYNNWTVTATTATAGYNQTYTATVAPYENYTIYIRNNTVWQDGTPVTAYDVYYSLIRVLLFDAGSPGTPGWIQAQSILPGDFYASNTFWNITQNMTYSNATNSITFHFQSPMSPAFFMETFGQTSGAQIASAKWIIAHGGGITWSPSGFEQYKNQGNQGSYNTYIQNHILADGPYQIAYIVPGLETVLTANPNFVSPGSFLPPAKIKTIYISYVLTPTDSYLALKSGQAQIGAIPSSSWNLEQQLEASGIVQNTSFPTLSIFWYNYNALINETMLHAVESKANMPYDLFLSLQARLAFSYAYDYNLYLGQQIGNDIYHVNFASAYAGMLPAGMLYEQSITDLNATTNGVPYFNLAIAQSIWANFINSSIGAAMGLSYSGGKDMFGGSPLDVPIFIFAGDPPDSAGATTWGQNLQKIIPGLQFQVEPTSFVQLLGWEVAGQNPMGVYELGWAPDYPYPNDYLVPMALPDPGTTYPGPNSMTLNYFYNQSAHSNVATSLLTNQLANLSAMYAYFNDSVANPANAQYDYQHWNEMLINMTFYTYIEQQVQFFIFSTKIPKSDFLNYQQNVMTGGGGDPYYNLLHYA